MAVSVMPKSRHLREQREGRLLYGGHHGNELPGFRNRREWVGISKQSQRSMGCEHMGSTQSHRLLPVRSTSG